MADPLPNRGNPDSDNFPSGPQRGEPVPTFTLPNQWNEPVTYKPNGTHQSLILFHRSADW
ncbi:MAG: hypothetical protein HOH77_13420 [Candidatus Latescibacteria bacterium]|nr:hypothetical protein [Candidatus Latescibacterota bacterium]